MRHRALELTDRFIPGVDRIVHRALAKAHEPPVIETDIVMKIGPQARLGLVGIDVADMEPVGVQLRAGRQQGLDFTGQLRCHHLVGVDIQYPVEARAILGIALLRPVARPVVGNDPRPQALRDSYSVVGRSAVDHDDIVGQAGKRADAVTDPQRLVLRNDAAAQAGDGGGHNGAFVPNAS